MASNLSRGTTGGPTLSQTNPVDDPHIGRRYGLEWVKGEVKTFSVQMVFHADTNAPGWIDDNGEIREGIPRVR